MSFVVKPVLAAAAAVLLLGTQFSDAYAVGDGASKDYATAAVRQVRLMHEHPACDRGTGARRSDDWNVHYGWCRNSSFEMIGAERDARTNWLHSCSGH